MGRKRNLKECVGERQTARRVRTAVRQLLESTSGSSSSTSEVSDDDVQLHNVNGVNHFEVASTSYEHHETLVTDLLTTGSGAGSDSSSNFSYDSIAYIEDSHESASSSSYEDSRSNGGGSDFDDNDGDMLWEETFRRKLSYWAVDGNVTRENVDKLLALLKTVPTLSFLPKCSKTLLGTSRVISTSSVPPGRYFAFSLVDGILSSLNSVQARFHNDDDTLKMFIGCDGMPSSKSSNREFWPILGLLEIPGAKPFEIGIYHGNSKPEDANEFLKHFENDMKNVIDNCLEYHGKQVKVEIKGFCCDAPALSFIKKVKPCGSYYGCMKCEIEGEYIFNANGRGGRVTYPQLDSELRCDESFRHREQAMHHSGTSILENLNVDMVLCFPNDPMHLVYLGCMRKLLHIWTYKRRLMKIKVTAQEMAEISQVLVDIHEVIPHEFSRKTRSLDELSRFKATEFRLLLLYVLPVVLRNRLPDPVYQHFLLLHVAIRILSCNVSVQAESNIEYAESLLAAFVRQSPGIYGEEFLTYNVHNLLHIGEDCRRFGALDNFSCFPFENHLGKLKNLVRRSAKPLEQIANRLLELRQNQPVVPLNISDHLNKLAGKHHSGPLIRGFSGEQFKSVIHKRFRLTCQPPDNCVVLTDSNDVTVIIIENIVEALDEQILLIGKKFTHSENFYNMNGLQSLPLGIQVVDELAENLETWRLESVISKAMKIPLKNTIFFPQQYVILNLWNFDKLK